MDFQNLKSFMDDMAKNHTVGNDCEVYLGGKSVIRYFSGYSDWENKTPLNGNELYNIYSCSKVATVTAGLQLIGYGYGLGVRTHMNPAVSGCISNM